MSQAGIVNVIQNNPEIPTQFDGNTGFAVPVANILQIYGDIALAGINPVVTQASGNTVWVFVQLAQAIPASDGQNVGLAAFDSTYFSVDVGGFVSLVTPTGITWNTISASQTLDVQNGYFCTGGGALSLLLPPVSALGDIIEVVLDGSASFTITQGAGQSIRIGNVSTTAGVGGSLASTQQGDSLKLVCQTANLKWNVVSSIGNPTVI